MQKSSESRGSKPAKPRPDFPLFPHASGRWAKKIRGKQHYFGPWRDAAGALAKYNRDRADLEAGRTPRSKGSEDGLRLGDPPNTANPTGLVNRFLTSKRHLVDTRELTERSFRDYHATCTRLVAVFGADRLVDDLTPADFEHLRGELAKKRGPVALANEIGRVRVVFKYASDNRLIERTVAYGQGFRKPSRKVLRKEKATRGPKIFEAAELKRIVDKAGQPLKTMVLLGINAGLGQSDIANLPRSAVDLDGGWLNYPRPKTGIDRRAKLWPETVKALQEYLAVRPASADEADDGLVFVTSHGARWVRTNKTGTEETDDEKWTNIDAISQEFRKVLLALKINGHRGFYCLRRGFETIGGESLDQVAVDHVMGHARDDMASVYRQRIGDDRLLKVAEHVRGWLFPAPVTEAKMHDVG